MRKRRHTLQSRADAQAGSREGEWRKWASHSVMHRRGHAKHGHVDNRKLRLMPRGARITQFLVYRHKTTLTSAKATWTTTLQPV